MFYVIIIFKKEGNRMLEEIIKEEIEVIIQEKGLKKIIKDIVRKKMSDENIQQIIEMEIDKLLPEAISESVRYEIEDNEAVHGMVYDKLSEMVKNKISGWEIRE